MCVCVCDGFPTSFLKNRTVFYMKSGVKDSDGVSVQMRV